MQCAHNNVISVIQVGVSLLGTSNRLRSHTDAFHTLNFFSLISLVLCTKLGPC